MSFECTLYYFVLSFIRDGEGRVTGMETEYDYDDAGRQTLVRDALGKETRHEYDIRGLRTATIDALGRRTGFIYDAVGRKFGEVDLAGELTDFEYDATGNLTAVVDALRRVGARHTATAAVDAVSPVRRAPT